MKIVQYERASLSIIVDMNMLLLPIRSYIFYSISNHKKKTCLQSFSNEILTLFLKASLLQSTFHLQIIRSKIFPRTSPCGTMPPNTSSACETESSNAPHAIPLNRAHQPPTERGGEASPRELQLDGLLHCVCMDKSRLRLSDSRDRSTTRAESMSLYTCSQGRHVRATGLEVRRRRRRRRHLVRLRGGGRAPWLQPRLLRRSGISR